MKNDHLPGSWLPIQPPEHLWHLGSRALDVSQVCKLTGRSPRTIARWRASGIDDVACLSVLQTHAYGLLPHPGWNEWLMGRDGHLGHWTGKRCLQFVPGQLHSMANAYSTASALRIEVAHLRDLLAAQARQRAPDEAANDDSHASMQLALGWP